MIFRQLLKSKLHGVVVTKKELYYEGSIGIDKKLMSEGDLIPGEKVEVLNFNNGHRFETYVIEEEEARTIALYGPAARLGEVGDKVCILSYVFANAQDANGQQQKIVIVDGRHE